MGSLESFFDFFCFHSPYHKLAQKGLTRLVYLDFLDHPSRPHYQVRSTAQQPISLDQSMMGWVSTPTYLLAPPSTTPPEGHTTRS